MSESKQEQRDTLELSAPIDPTLKWDLPEVERDASGIPTFVFRETLPEKDRPTADVKALEVTMLWRDTVMSVTHVRKPAPVTIGPTSENDFQIAAEALVVDRFKLVDVVDGKMVVNALGGMSMEARIENGEILTRDELVKRGLVRVGQVHGQDVSHHGKDLKAYQYTIGLNDRVAVECGQQTFVLQYIKPAKLLTTSFTQTMDFYFTKVLGLTFVVQLFLLLALAITPSDPEAGLDEDLFKNPNRFAKLLLKEPEKKKEEPKKKIELSGSKGGGRHKGDEGKFGKPDKKPQDALASTKGAPRIDPNKREQDRKIAMNSGILATLSGGSGAVSNVFGPGGLGTGINNALGGLRGTAMGDAGGAGGLGSRGTGPGGGGNSMGIGGLGDGTGRGTGGLGNVDLGGRGKGQYNVTPGRTIMKGCLSQEVVGRVINRHMSQVKYCYEKELQKNPNLSGKIVTQFLIGATGDVTSSRASENTLGDANVEDCVLRVINRMKFPPCAGGGTADVTYPWIFKSGGN